MGLLLHGKNKLLDRSPSWKEINLSTKTFSRLLWNLKFIYRVHM